MTARKGDYALRFGSEYSVLLYVCISGVTPWSCSVNRGLCVAADARHGDARPVTEEFGAAEF